MVCQFVAISSFTEPYRPPQPWHDGDVTTISLWRCEIPHLPHHPPRLSRERWHCRWSKPLVQPFHHHQHHHHGTTKNGRERRKWNHSQSSTHFIRHGSAEWPSHGHGRVNINDTPRPTQSTRRNHCHPTSAGASPATAWWDDSQTTITQTSNHFLLGIGSKLLFLYSCYFFHHNNFCA